MKKLLYSIGALLLMASCSDNYTDWADPQSNTEEPKTVTLALAPAADINFATLTTDSVQLFVPTITASEAGVNSYTAKLYNADKSASKTLQVDAQGRVKSSELADSINALYTCRPTQRTIAMDVTAFTKINGQSIQTTGTTTVKATPNAPEIDNTYYLTGTINSWNYNDKTFAAILISIPFSASRSPQHKLAQAWSSNLRRPPTSVSKTNVSQLPRMQQRARSLTTMRAGL